MIFLKEIWLILGLAAVLFGMGTCEQEVFGKHTLGSSTNEVVKTMEGEDL